VELVPTSMTARGTPLAEGEGGVDGESGFKRFHKSHVAEGRLWELSGISGTPVLATPLAPPQETDISHFPLAIRPSRARIIWRQFVAAGIGHACTQTRCARQ